MLRKTLLLVQWIAVLGHASAQTPGREEHLYPERLHEDIELLRSAIHEAHPDPYRYRTRLELDATIDAVKERISTPMGLFEFQRALLPIFTAVGDANCHATWPARISTFLSADARLIPIQVRILPEGLFVEDELKGFRSIPTGSRILTINDRPAMEIVDLLMATVVTDGADRAYAERVVERDLPQRYHVFVEDVPVFNVRYMTPDKLVSEQAVFALTGKEIARTRKPSGFAMLPWGTRWESQGDVLWFTMRTLDPDSLLRAGIRVDRFLDALLLDARKNKARTLVIDLRGAAGRDLGIAEEVFAAFAKEPFKVLDDLLVRSITMPKERASHEVPVDFYASSNMKLLPAAQGAYRVLRNDERLAEHEPHPKAYQGKIYMICDGATRDAAAALVMMARRSGRARVVGEETGSNAHGFTGGAEWLVTATHSGLDFHIPLIKYVPAGRADGPVDRGEQPHHRAFQQVGAMVNGQDAIKNSLLQLIREIQ